MNAIKNGLLRAIKRQICLGVLLLMLSSYGINTVFATAHYPKMQQQRITGKITENGDPLPGISVRVKATNQGTSSNEKGEYTINAKKGDVLIFSSVGYVAQEIKVGDNKVIDVSLKANAEELNQVIVVGYGTQKKSDLTNAVTSVSFEELENIPQTDIMNVLSGRVAGLTIVQASGQPGGGDDPNDITIRGTGTLNDATPLIVIDGVQSEASDLRMLSPQEIASITILKDASSTAIYGARGANGVILVTTKAPKEGAFKISYNTYIGRQKETVTPRFVNGWQFLTLHLEASDKPDMFPPEAIEQLKQGIATDTFAYYNPVKDVFRGAWQHSHNVSLSGGTKALSFQGSVNYLNQEGVINGTYGDKINYRSNIRANVSSKVILSLNISGGREKSHENWGSSRGTMQNLYRAYIITPKFYSTGGWGIQNLKTGAVAIPPGLYAQLGRRDDIFNILNLSPSFTYIPIKDLTLKSQLNIRSTSLIRESFKPTYEFYLPDGTQAAGAAYNTINTLIDFRNNVTQLQFTNTANYKLNIQRKHRLDFLLGYEYLNAAINRIQANGSNLPNNDQQVLSRATSNISITQTDEEWKLQSFFGRMNYAFKNKYMLETNLRTDGSSRFPRNKQYVLLPSVSAGWMVTNEEFFKKLGGVRKVVDELKIRAGWGRAGNDKMEQGRGQLGNYAHLQTLNMENYYYFGEQLQTGTAITAYANENISWERTTTKGIGLDLNMFKRKLDITFDLYDRITNDILFRVPLPPSFGLATPAVQNIASVSNKGWELAVNYRFAKNKVNFNIGGNIAYNQNKILSLNLEETVIDPFILRVGEAYNSYYGYVQDGIMKDASEKNYTMNGNIGNMKFKDLSGPNGVPDGKIDDKDRTILGSANIPYSYGINGGVNYKRFNFSFLLQGVQGKQLYLKDWGNRPGDGAVMNFWAEWWDNRYDAVNNPEGTWPTMARSNPGAGVTSSFWIHDASYLRLRNVELGYTFTDKFTSRLGLGKARVYVAGQNLLTFTNLIKQVDPERRALEASNTTYSQVKLVTAGFNITF